MAAKTKTEPMTLGNMRELGASMSCASTENTVEFAQCDQKTSHAGGNG